MPDLKELSAGELGLRPNDAATEGAVQAGRRVGSFYSQIGQDVGQDITRLGDAYVEHQTQQEISQGYASGQTVLNGLDQSLENTAKDADPNDPTWAKKYVDEQITPAVQAWQNSFKTERGKMFAAEHGASMTEALTRKALALRASKAGDAAVENINQGTNQGAAVVYRDPAQLDNVLGTSDAGIKASVQAHPNIDPETASKMTTTVSAKAREQIVTSAIFGLMQQGQTGIDKARTLIASGKYDDEIDEQQRKVFTNELDSRERLLKEQDKAAENQAFEQGKRNGEDKLNQWRFANMDPTTGITTYGPKAVTDLANLATVYGKYAPEAFKAAQAAVEESLRRTINHDNVASDPTTATQLWARVGKPPTAGGLSASDVDTAYGQGKLSDHDATRLHSAIESVAGDQGERDLATRRTEFLTSQKAVFGHANLLGNFTDGATAERFYEFQTDTMDKEAAMRRAGKSPAEIAATLYNSRDPAYQGLRVGQYTIDNKTGAAIAASSAAGKATRLAPPSLTAGESAAAHAAPPGQTPNPTATLRPDQKAWLDAHK